MASWDKPRQQDDLEPCPICLANITRKKKQKHVFTCSEAYRDQLEKMSIVRCPLYEAHLVPFKFLNHHLEGNCDAANNRLRKYFEDINFSIKVNQVPDDFLPEYSSEILNEHNRKLLYFLLRCPDEGVMEGVAASDLNPNPADDLD